MPGPPSLMATLSEAMLPPRIDISRGPSERGVCRSWDNISPGHPIDARRSACPTPPAMVRTFGSDGPDPGEALKFAGSASQAGRRRVGGRQRRVRKRVGAGRRPALRTSEW